MNGIDGREEGKDSQGQAFENGAMAWADFFIQTCVGT